MGKSYLTIEKISAYNKSFNFSNEVWNKVVRWDYFAKDTVGKQFVRSADSVFANIAEGFGRFSKKDKTRFYRIGAGSLEEKGDWIRKSSVRKLISDEQEQVFLKNLEEIRKEIFHLINFTNEKLNY